MANEKLLTIEKQEQLELATKRERQEALEVSNFLKFVYLCSLNVKLMLLLFETLQHTKYIKVEE